ncbi:uncharacterized protein LOC101846747 [Aplysia californica]|uniref:Uncharacterized protein LOC101846747 n=1 Tax=Aplysia californica TaxID=6500 RepID=A0ABM0JUP4_APLCA|nr:uncharacterized protein LOC101846747 [Aplysia californica]
MTKSLVLLIVCACIGSSWCGPFEFPFHASCNIDWTFGATCQNVSQIIQAQIQKWSGTSCGSGEKCRYEFVSFDNNILKAKHTTPVKHYADDLTFVFKPNSSLCLVNGKSSSETWYAVLDDGTNYCNLHNLITGSGLDKLKPYKESTSNSKCTQYSSANCEKY